MLRIFMFDTDRCTVHEASILYRSLCKTFPRDKVFIRMCRKTPCFSCGECQLVLKEWVKVAERKLEEIEKRFE